MTMQTLIDLAFEMNAEVSFGMDNTCVNASVGDSFICTPDFNSREENMQSCIEFLTELKPSAHVIKVHPCDACEKHSSYCAGCMPF